MDVAAWLPGLGLERYAPAFRDNEIDGEVLPELTAEDLIGPRRDLDRPSPQAARRHRRAGAAAARPRGSIGDERDICCNRRSDRGRTPAADGDVLRPGRLDRALDPS